MSLAAWFRKWPFSRRLDPFWASRSGRNVGPDQDNTEIWKSEESLVVAKKTGPAPDQQVQTPSQC